MALGAEVAMMHEPVLRLGIEQPLVGDVGGVGHTRSSDRSECQPNALEP